MINKYYHPVCSSLVLSAFLTACGGGGSKEVTNTNIAKQPHALHAENMQGVNMLSRKANATLTATSSEDSITITYKRSNISSDKHYQFFINTDNLSSTGFQFDDEAWDQSGADYLIEDDILYKSNSNDDSWDWDEIDDEVIFKTTSSSVSMTIKKSLLKGLKPQLRIGFMERDSDWDVDDFYPKSSQMALLSIDVTSTDTVAPVISLNGSASMQLQKGTAFSDPGAIAHDDVDGDISNKIITNSTIDINNIGTYNVTYSISDKANNTSTITRKVIIVDSLEAGIVIDGKTDDWVNIPEVASNNTGTIKFSSSKTHLHILIQAENLGENTQVFLDTDNDSTTGMRFFGGAWENAGVDYMIENRILFKSKNPNSWSWKYNVAPIDYINKNGVIEIAIKRSDLEKLGKTINIGFVNRDSNWNIIDDTLPKNGLKKVQITNIPAGIDKTPPNIHILGSNPVNLVKDTSYIDARATATDNIDGTVSVVISGAVDTSIVKTYAVTYTATDAAGNTATATRTVNVISADTISPVISVLGDNPVNIEKEKSYIDTGATASDNVDGVIKVTTTNAVDTTTVGAYTVHYAATDAAGNTITATRTVNVTALPPKIQLLGNNPTNVTQNSSYNDFGATAVDEMGNSISVSTSGAVDTKTIGEYIITYTATDSTGSIATATRVINVVTSGLVDTTAPKIQILGSQIITMPKNANYTDEGATATDNIDNSVAVSVTGTVDTNTIGSYNITYTATDMAGNTTTAVRVINIINNSGNDTMPPNIDILGSQITNIEKGTNYTDKGAIAFDNIDGSINIITTGSVDTSTVGAYTINYMATDSAKNTTTSIRTVNIVDISGDNSLPPNINILGYDTITVVKNANYKALIANSINATANVIDNIGRSINHTTTNNVDTTKEGTYNITYTATDVNGNTSTATRTVNVIKSNSADKTLPFFHVARDPIIGYQVINVLKDSSYAKATVAYDEHDAKELTVVSTGSVDTSKYGTYYITHSATDRTGNTNTVIHSINVVDNQGLFGKLPSEAERLDLEVSNVRYNPHKGNTCGGVPCSQIITSTPKLWPHFSTLRVAFDFSAIDSRARFNSLSYAKEDESGRPQTLPPLDPLDPYDPLYRSICKKDQDNDTCENNVKSHIMEKIEQWSKYSSLKFEKSNSWKTADIRVTFNDDGAHSQVGVDSLQRRSGSTSGHASALQSWASMNLGFFSGGTIVHEFGHAIGLNHEQNRSDRPLIFNEKKVRETLTEEGWSEEKIRHNVLDQKNINADSYLRELDSYDPRSIMQYTIPLSWVENTANCPLPKDPNQQNRNYCIEPNLILSSLDKTGIAKLYPELPDIFKNGLEKIDGIFEPTKRLDLNGIASLYFVIIEKVPEIKEEEVARGDTKINISVKWTGEETRVTSKCKGDILRELGGKICYRAESADFQAKVTYQKKIKDSFSSEVAAGYLNFTVTGDRYLSFNWARPFGSSLLSPNKEQIGKAIRKSAHLFVKE